MNLRPPVPQDAEEFAVHVLDVYDHYRFRAVEAEIASAKRRNAGAPSDTRWDGFLNTSDSWQSKVSRGLAQYFTE